MPTLRIPLAEPLTNRDSSAIKDSKLTNCFAQNVGGQSVVIKRPGTLLAAQNSVGQGQGTYCYNGSNWSISNNTLTNRTPVYGASWTSSTGFPSRQDHTSVVFNNKLWVIGGTTPTQTYTNDVWSSVDGVNWTQVTPAAAFSPRFGHSSVVFNGRMYVIAGQTATGVETDVWSSTDGITWTADTISAGFVGRFAHSSVVFNNTLYVLGGQNGLGATLSDVWKTTTGSVWTQVTQVIPFSPRKNHKSVSFNGSMYIIAGGDSAGTPVNTVIHSSDGANWYQYTAPWSARSGVCAEIFNGRIYMVAGSSPTLGLYLQDVWSSGDGFNWVQTTVTSPYTAVAGATSGILNGNLFLLGGIVVSTGAYSTNSWNTSGLSTAVSSAVSTYTLSSDNLPYQFLSSGGINNPILVLKNNNQMYVYNISTGIPTLVSSANYPSTTVPGLVYLDNTYYVGTPDGRIFGSNLGDPTTWSALNYTSAEIENDGLIAIEKTLNYLVAFGEWTTEFFYDAGNATGSPLSSVPNAFFTVGCASGTSVVRMENEVVWMSQTIQRGRQIMALSGFTPQVLSSPEVDRILNADDLSSVYAFSIKIAGSSFYVLTLKTSAKTLVYDFATKQWHFWTSMIVQAPKSITSITSVNGVATVTQPSHGYADGDLITIAGATPAAYNGNFNITYIDANTYSYPVPLGTSSPATGTITSVGYTESYFNAVAYSFCQGGDLIQGETDGAIYKVSPSYYNDNGNYINMKIKTVRVDGGNTKRKFVSRAEIVGDKISATGLLRYSDDDYQTYSIYRPIDLSAKRSILLRQGHSRRRAYEFRCTTSQPIRLSAIELDVKEGTS